MARLSYMSSGAGNLENKMFGKPFQTGAYCAVATQPTIPTSLDVDLRIDDYSPVNITFIDRPNAHLLIGIVRFHQCCFLHHVPYAPISLSPPFSQEAVLTAIQWHEGSSRR